MEQKPPKKATYEMVCESGKFSGGTFVGSIKRYLPFGQVKTDETKEKK